MIQELLILLTIRPLGPGQKSVSETLDAWHNSRVQSILVFFLSFVAYATGAVWCKRVSSSRPSSLVHPVEVLLVGGLLLLIGLLRPVRFSAKYHIIAVLAMLVIGAMIARLTSVKEGWATAGTREFENLREEAKPTNLWKRWLSFSHAVVDYEFRLFLVAVYLVIIGPFAIAFRLLKAKPRPAIESSTWTARTDNASLEAARRPF